MPRARDAHAVRALCERDDFILSKVKDLNSLATEILRFAQNDKYRHLSLFS